MTLARLRAQYKHLFHRNQDWFNEESFMQTRLVEPVMPTHVVRGAKAHEAKRLPHAVELAAAYVECPDNPIWDEYIWTCDKDKLGQRVFVGGCANGYGFEIHRHLQITKRWGIPVW